MLQVKQALQGIGYGIIGALIVQVSFNTIIKERQEQALTKPILLKGLSQKEIDSITNDVHMAPVKSKEQNSSFKPYIVSPVPVYDKNESKVQQ